MDPDKRGTVKRRRDRLTDLFRRRSVIALLAGSLTVILAFYGLVAGIDNMIKSTGKSGLDSFVYFTMISNAFAALAAAFTVPFAAEGIRKSRFTLPGWVATFYYIAAVSIAIVMLFVAFVVSWADPAEAAAAAFSRGLMNGMKEKEAKTSGKRKSL